MIQLSKRLEAIRSCLLIETEKFADIGSDHALLPCAVCLEEENKQAIVSDIHEGPLKSARKNVSLYELNNRIQLRLGDGLSILQPFEVEEVIISGMGGTLITDIIKKDLEILKSVGRVIIQPNIDTELVRKLLNEHLFHIVDEKVVKDRHHYYEIIVAEQNKQRQTLTERELFLGPKLLERQTPLFYEKLKKDKRKLEKIIKSISRSSEAEERKALFQRQLHWIKELI